METTKGLEKEITNSKTLNSIDKIQDYLDQEVKRSKLTVKGVVLCITSIVPLLLLLMLSNSGYMELSAKYATVLGLISLFLIIITAVSLFIRTQLYEVKIDASNKLDQRLSEHVNNEINTYKPVYLKRITLAIALFLFSVVPLITVSILTNSSDLSLLMVVVTLIIISLGITIIIPTSTYYTALNTLINFNNPAVKSKRRKMLERVTLVYWTLTLTLYLGYSLWTMDWGRSWILWPLASLLFFVLIVVMNLHDSND